MLSLLQYFQFFQHISSQTFTLGNLLMLKFTSLVLGLLTVIAIAPNQAMAATDLPQVPDNLQVPIDQKLLLKAPAQGSQIYICRANKESQFAWTLKAPDAQLLDAESNIIGKHYGGPTWESNDGSKVTAVVKAKTSSPNGSIPLLLLEVNSAKGEGIFTNVKSIQRLNTTGGNAPQEDCNADRSNTEVAVPYTADYYFYGVAKREDC
jgi:Protein of unknown function (DUF3455)